MICISISLLTRRINARTAIPDDVKMSWKREDQHDHNHGTREE